MEDNPVAKLSCRISDKHEKFLATVGEIPYKVSADYALLLTMVTSKINLVASLMRLSGVIDNHTETRQNGCNVITLSKEGLDFRVEVLTNGTSILIRAAGSEMDEGNPFSPKNQRLYPYKSAWDWEQFVDVLLGFIHQSMYSSQRSEEINFDMLMKGMEI
jgi:hypothetical protein